VACSGGVLCGIVHGAGNAMLMLGGACAAELRLMGLVFGTCCATVIVFFVYDPFVRVVLFCVEWLFGVGFF